MPQRPCLVCGRLSDESRCARHRKREGGSSDVRGSGGKRATFRRRTLKLTGGRCVVPGCYTPFDRVQAHHVVPLADGGDPDGPGVPLCRLHHRLASKPARLSGNW